MGTFEREGATVRSSKVLHSETVSLRIDDAGLSLDGKLVVAREDVVLVAFALEERTIVLVRAKDGASYAFPFTNRKDADALVLALGRTPDRTVLELGVAPSLLRAGFHPLPPWSAAALIAFAVLLIALIPFLARPMVNGPRLGGIFARTLEIGADGIRIRGRLADEFLPWASIASVSSRDDAVVLALRDGRESTLPLEVGSRLGEVVARISEAVADAAAAPPIDADVVRLLDGVEGTNAEKVAALREVGGEGDVAYRAARVPRERLWSLVEDPVVPAATRARAAVALSETTSPDERFRLRIAAEASVSPKVRVAIDAAARNDEELANKLADVDVEEPPGSLRHLRVS